MKGMNRMVTFGISFSDIEWGEDEARNDNSLNHYFVEFPGFDRILAGKKRYIIGRKGTGKTAILQKLRLQAEADPMRFYTDISLRDFPLNSFKSLGDRSLHDKAKYVPAWKFLMLTELANLIIQDNSIEPSRELEQLKSFIGENFPNGTSVTETINKLRQNENKINVTFPPLSGENTGTTSTETVSFVHYNRAVKKLEELLQFIHTESCFVLLIDELDEGYRVENSNLNLIILSLLRATDEIYNTCKNVGLNCLPILALRSDIFDSLEDNDLNKLDDYVLRLNWTTDEEDPWSLKQIAEKRIAATLREKSIDIETTNYWNLVADDTSYPKGLWQYICNLTFSRPRDIIKLLKYCSNTCSSKLKITDVKKAEVTYSDWFYREFRDEVQSFLPCWKEAMNCLSEVAKGKEKIAILNDRMTNNDEIKKWCQDNCKSAIDVIRILFNYSVIGCINENGRWIFKYKDDYFDFMPSYPYYCIHYGFCRKLRIPRSYDRMYLDTVQQYQ